MCLGRNFKLKSGDLLCAPLGLALVFALDSRQPTSDLAKYPPYPHRPLRHTNSAPACQTRWRFHCRCCWLNAPTLTRGLAASAA